MRYCIVILAGGRSTRFGEPKQLYKIAGKEMIEWVLSSAERTGADVLVSIKRSNEYVLPFIATHSALPVYDDLDYYSPLIGLCSAAKACRHELVVVVPSDSPFITSKFITKLIESLEKLKVSAIIPIHDDGLIEAIHAAYKKTDLLIACEKAIKNMDFAVKALPRYLSSVYFMPVSEMEKDEAISLYDFDEKLDLINFKT